MSKKQVEVFFDYSCPFCYLGLNHLNSVKDKYPDLEFVYRPSEAHPDNEEQIDINKTMGFWKRKIARILGKENIPYNIPYSPLSRSNIAFQAFHFILDNNGDIGCFHDNVFQAMYVDQKNIEDIDVLVTCAQGCKVDLDKLKASLTNKEYLELGVKDLEYAFITSKIAYVPTLIYQDKRLDSIVGKGFSKQQLIDFLDSI